MEGNMREYLDDELIGNVRTGTRGEKDNPVKLAYFDVHTDKSTSELAVEIFNEVYNKPSRLKIKFVNQNPMNVGFQKYEGKKLKCYGNGKEARLLDDKGKRQTIGCNPIECPYRQNRQCKMVGRLHFIIEKLEDEGIWCYPMGSEKGIRNIWRRISRSNRIGENLTNDWYELYLKAEDAIVGKNYIPDIRKLQKIDSKNNIEKLTNNNEENNNKQNTNKFNFLKIINFQKMKYENKEATRIIFVDTSSKKQELILIPESKQDILKVGAESIILPLSISKRNNCSILNDYKIVKEVLKNKKAV